MLHKERERDAACLFCDALFRVHSFFFCPTLSFFSCFFVSGVFCFLFIFRPRFVSGYIFNYFCVPGALRGVFHSCIFTHLSYHFLACVSQLNVFTSLTCFSFLTSLRSTDSYSLYSRVSVLYISFISSSHISRFFFLLKSHSPHFLTLTSHNSVFIFFRPTVFTFFILCPNSFDAREASTGHHKVHEHSSLGRRSRFTLEALRQNFQVIN